MAKHIGIVACSAEGAALCYRTLCTEAPAAMGAHMHPEVSMHTHPLGEYMVHVRSGHWPGVAALMLSSAKKLERAGAEIAICPDNTIHQAFDLGWSLLRRYHGSTSRTPSPRKPNHSDSVPWRSRERST